MANKFKKALALVLAAAMVVTVAPAPAASTAEAATKATKGTTKITASASSATITEGASKTIKVTVNKKQKKALKVTLKSSKASVAKVAKSVTIKKGKKAASFKITGKGTGTAKITATTTNAKGKSIKTTIKVTVKAKDNEEDNSANVTVIDADGLQSDGTGLVGDTLYLSYGSSMGVPELITWYYNEQVASSLRADAEAITKALSLKTGGTILRDGKYYAVITNKNGKTYTSNTLTLTYNELKGSMSDFSIQDDYTTKANITAKTDDNNAVLSVTLDKDYFGTFYVYEGGTSKYTTTAVETVDNTYAAAYGSSATGEWAIMNTEAELTAKNAIKWSNTSGIVGIKYTTKTGKTTYMWKTNASNGAGLTRGKTYKVVYDQEGIDSDDISTVSRTDVTATDAVTAPYLEAPAMVVVGLVAKGQHAKVGFANAKGVMTWLGTGANADGFDSVVVYGNSSAKTEGAGSKVNAGTIDEGVWTSTSVIQSNETASYFYAVAKTTAGVFGADSATLTSEFKATNVAVSEAPTLEENSDTPTQADVTVGGVTTEGTVYVLKAEVAIKTLAGSTAAAEYTRSNTPALASVVKTITDDTATFDESDSQSYVGKAEVKAGQGTVNVSGVFDKKDIANGNVQGFYAVVIPKDTLTYAPAYPDVAKGLFVLKQTPTTVQVGTSAPTLAISGSAIVVSNLVPYDQFGQVCEQSTDGAKTATVAAINSTAATKEAADAEYSCASGKLTLTVTPTTTSNHADKGDGYAVTVLGSTIKITSLNDQDKTWYKDNIKVVVDGSTVIAGEEGHTGDRLN